MLFTAQQVMLSFYSCINIMSEGQDIDRLMEEGGGPFAPDADRNDSIENNADNRSNRDQENNLLDQNYEKNWQKNHDLNLAKDIYDVDNKKDEFEKNSIEYRLINNQNFEDYDEALSEYTSNIGIYTVSRLTDIVKIILQSRKNISNEIMELSRNIFFLKELSNKFKQIQNIEIYRQAIGEILKPGRQFYRYNFNEESLQILNIYLQEEFLDFTSINQFISEYFQSEMDPILPSPEPYLYRFVYNLILNSCLREGKYLFNLFLISRADPSDQQAYMKDYQSSFVIQDYSQVEKRELEDYLQILLEICKNKDYFLHKYIFGGVQWLLEVSQQMDKKLLGFRIINELIIDSNTRDKHKYMLVNWLNQNKIVEIFLKDSTHSRILQQIQPVLHFLYESGVLSDNEIIELMKNSLHSQEIFKVVQSMLGWLKLKHLFLVFQIIPYFSDRESTLYINFINSLLSNPLISDDNTRKRKNLIIQDNRREMEGEPIQVDMDIEEEYCESTQQFVKKLMHFLIELVVQHQNNYMPILLKLITAHSRIFKDDLQFEIIKLFRNGSVCSLWIIEHWLKIETSRDRGQGKHEIITKLASEGVFQLMLALLARNRFSRPVVEKALSVIIIFCRFNRPLEKSITEFLWKVLGNTGRDEREREQFFVFLKELVRYQGSVTEESVNFIFFDILMSLVAGWFSFRVYDCLEMLFLRLNEDCKLINFQKDQYKIVKEPLIGTDKFIYIYFNSMDLKVVKKCRDFICKLIMNSEETKEALYMYLIGCLKKYMTFAIQMVKNDESNKRQVIILRVFQIAEKLSLEKQKIEEAKENTINLHIQVSNMYTLGARNSNMEFNEKITLSDLRRYIGDNMNPPASSIELWTKGKLLKGENLTIKELKLENNQTIGVTKADDMEGEEDKNLKKKEQLELLISLIGDEADPELLKYIINKFQGETIETIANNLFDPERMKQLEDQFKDKQFQQEDVILEVENIKEKAQSFGTLLVHHKDIFQMLLQCLKISGNKAGGWNFIKKLPLNEEYVEQVNQNLLSGEWEKLFSNRIVEQELYIIHIISNNLKQNCTEVNDIFEVKGLRKYLLSWLSQIIDNYPEEIVNYEDLFKLLLMEIDCPVITLFDEFLNNKTINEKDFQIIPLYEDLILKGKTRWKFGLTSQSTSKMIECLMTSSINGKLASLIGKMYILQLIYPAEKNKFYSILAHQKLELLLLKYGKPIQFIVIATALHLNSQSNQHFLPKFTFRLLSTFRQELHDKQIKYYYSSFFSCLNQLLTISCVFDSNEELNILTQILYQMKGRIKELEQEEIVGYFKICQTLLDRHFKSDHGGERKNLDIYNFAAWMFNEYLFGIKNQHPFFTSKHLRKAAYQFLIKMCGYTDVLKTIAQSIRSLMKGFKDSNEVEGEIRSSNLEFNGIKNLGATCYINSLIQQLYHTAFPAILLEDENDPSSKDDIKLLQLKKIFANLYCGIRSPVYPNDYVDSVKINGEVVRPMVQQDVNEFFASLMHEVEQTVGSRALNETICGTLCHEIRGLEEGSQVKNVDEAFLTLMIDIKYRKNLLQALSSLSKPHFLEGENMYYSQVLHKKIRASSRTYLGKLPNILVITLKRFYWNFEQMNRIKINDYFEFPLELDLSGFAMQGRKETDPHYFDYKLCGIIIHSGSAESGHYYSFIKVGERWLQFNDRKVTEWDMQNNLKSECFGNDEKSKNAYMLFYERTNSQAHGCALSRLPQDNRLIQMIQQENQNFVLNRLIYDSNFIDFIKQLSKFEQYSSILTVLDSLKYYRQTPEVYYQKPEVLEEKKTPQFSAKPDICPMVEEDEEERRPLMQEEPVHVTQEEVKELVQRHFPGSFKGREEVMEEEETPQFKQL